ncbi:DNA ligase [Rhodotorula toruloides ATCC 204091]|uniref:DNA ligase n=1 Tax=Rhodotorula toruloides TaxID=5286 RepID=A0A0K3C4T6_RHOTO|nr:DNA ligase [Rhodotorula toruloides ATCC 204091]PRQ77892.1 DNA ligase [Rhodotorula toruloides]
MAKSPAKAQNLDSFFKPPPSNKRTAPLPSTPSKARKTNGEDVRDGKGKGKAVQDLGEVVLDDSDEDERMNGQDEEDDGDDLVIVEPDGAGEKQIRLGKVKEEVEEPKPAKPPPPVASIFQKRTPASPNSPAKSSTLLSSPKVEVDADTKPDIKPSPTKNIAIFDTAAASSSTSAGSEAGPSSSTSKPLDTPLFSFSPAQDVSFGSHNRVPFSFLSDALVLISSTKSRLFIQLVLTNLLRTVIELDPESLLSLVYLCSNRIGPSYEKDTELGIGWQVLSKAIKETSGATAQKLKQLSNKHGDPGDIAFEASKSVRLLVKPTPLECHGVYKILTQIAKLKGTGVLNQKTSLVKKLLLSSSGEQVRYIVRILVSNLRIGAVRLTLLTALARAFCLSRPKGREPSEESEAQKGQLELEVDEKLKRAEACVRRVWARHPNFGHLVEALLEGGLEQLEERVGLSIGVPLEPMLGSITRSLDDIYTRLGSRPFVSEAKLDGQRGQIHVWVGDSRPEGVAEGSGKWFVDEESGRRAWVRMFSRHLEDMTEKYPDVGGTILGILARAEMSETPLRNFVIDCEVVAIDPKTGAFKTFQELSYRSKKDVELGDIKVRVGIYCFDLMFLNDESLLSRPFRSRRDTLRSLFPPLQPTDPRFAKWELIPCCTDNDPEKVREFFEETLKMKAEGIMVKLLDEAEVEVTDAGEGENGANGANGQEEEEVDYASGGEASSSGSRSSSNSPRPQPKNGKTGGKSRRKVLPATYEPDKRADSWLKVKKDYLDEVGDSLDLVPIAAWWGQGRKAGWWSPFLLACYDEETGAYTAVTKCLSGFTDAFYKEMREKYNPEPENPLTSKTPWPEVEAGSLSPDIWFKPNEVWEIRGADFTLSPVYPAARSQLGNERGVSIRFPRFIKIRDDKGIEQATSAEQLAQLYEMQGAPAGGGASKPAKVEDGDEV